MRRQPRDCEKDHAKWIAARVAPSLTAILTRSARLVGPHLPHELASMRFDRKRLTGIRAARLTRERLERVGDPA